MSADRFLSLVTDQGLIDEKLAARFRRALKKSSKSVSARKLAKKLVDDGHLTVSQAKKMLDQFAVASPPLPVEDDLTEVPTGPEEAELELQVIEDRPLEVVDELVEPVDSGDDAEEVLELVEVEDDEVVESVDRKLPGDAKRGGAEASSTDTTVVLDDAEGLAEEGLADHLEVAAASSSRPRKPRGLKALFGGLGKGPKKRRGNQWDSPLMLVGGGGLLLLILLGGFLYFYLARGSGDELFQAAEDFYSSQSYVQAISQYEKFLKRFESHPKASLARVRIDMSRFRRLVESGNQWNQALAEANEILPEIKKESAFEEARPELSSLLPDIYDGFVTQAEESQDLSATEGLLEDAARARELVDNPEYLPSSLRKPQQSRIVKIEDRIAVLRREIDRDKELVAAIAKMAEATDRGDTPGAYAIRKELLSRYPGLRVNRQLREAVLVIAKKEGESVRLFGEPRPAVDSEPNSGRVRKIVLANTTGESAEGAGGQVLYVLIRGAVYGLDAVSGEVLWRRFVGYQTVHPPQPIDAKPGADAIVSDARSGHLLRLAARDGKVIWRQQVGLRATKSLVTPRAILLGNAEGVLLSIDPETGTIEKQVQLPQPISVAPQTNAQQPFVYVLGQHSSLYVLAMETLECIDVAYSAHRVGSVVVPPVGTSGQTFLAENVGDDHALIHTLPYDEEFQHTSALAAPRRVEGHVTTAMSVQGRSVFLTTDRGATYVLNVDGSGGGQPVRLVAKTLPLLRQPQPSYCTVQNANVYVADQRLAAYQLQKASGKLVRQWTVQENDTFVAAPQRIGNLLISVRRAARSAAFQVSALRAGSAAQEGGATIWETELAAQPAGEIMVDARRRKFIYVSSSGSLWDIDGDVLRRGKAVRATERAASAEGAAYTYQVPLADGSVLFATEPPTRDMLIYQGDEDRRLRRLRLKVGADEWTAYPVAMGNQVIVAASSGQVHLVDGTTGRPTVLPFQPPMTAGSNTQWFNPIVLDADANSFVVADHEGNLYRVGIASQPEPHLEQQATANEASPLAANPAFDGTAIYLVTEVAGKHQVIAYRGDDLNRGQQWPLDARVVWGPRSLGSWVILATDDDRLHTFSAGKPVWTADLPHGPLAGPPLLVSGRLVGTSLSGHLWQLDAGSGKSVPWATGDQRTRDIGEPLGAGAIAFGGRLLVSGRDGTLLLTDMPGGTDRSATTGTP